MSTIQDITLSAVDVLWHKVVMDWNDHPGIPLTFTDEEGRTPPGDLQAVLVLCIENHLKGIVSEAIDTLEAFIQRVEDGADTMPPALVVNVRERVAMLEESIEEPVT